MTKLYVEQKLLITGAGGAIGRALAEYILLNTDYNLVLSYYLNAEIPSYIDRFKDRIKVVVGDISNFETLQNMFDDINTIIHLASSVNPVAYNGDFINAYSYGVNSTFALLDFIKNTSEKLHFIFPSSGGTVYSNNKNVPHKETDLIQGVSPYGIQKIMFENYLNLICSRNKNISCNILRISNPYGLSLKSGRKQGFIDVALHKIINNEQIEIWSSLDTIRDYIYIEDLCHAFIKSIEYKNGINIFNVGSGKGVSIREILTLLESVFKRNINYKTIEANLYYPEYSVLDITKANNILNWEPKVELKKGIEKILETINGELNVNT